MRNLGVKDQVLQREMAGINPLYYGIVKSVQMASGNNKYPEKISITRPIEISSDLFIPSNVSLYFTFEGRFVVKTGNTLEIEGSIFSEGGSVFEVEPEGVLIYDKSKKFDIEEMVTNNKKPDFNDGVAISDNIPDDTTNTIYNIGGILYWNGSALGGGAASSLWELDSSTVIRPKDGRLIDYSVIDNVPVASDYDISDLSDSLGWKSTLATAKDLLSSSVYTVNDKINEGVLYVSVDGNDTNTGESMQDSMLTIQHAIDSATSGDTIIVGAGTYEISSEIYLDKDLTIIGMYGAESTIVKPAAGLQIRCMYITGTKNSKIIGFTFKDGNTVLGGLGENPGNGGGVCIWQDTGTTPERIGSYIEDCIIENCSANQYGGGIYLMDHKSAVVNTIIRNCSVPGGGLSGGGGIGLRWEGYVYNCLIYGCDAVNGGGILCHSGINRVENTTISDNVGGGGITFYNGSGSGHILYNSIVVDNAGGNIISLGGATDIKYTCSSPLVAGDYNIDEDPLFVDQSGSDYSITSGSPVIDKGLLRPWHKDFTDIKGLKIKYSISLGCYLYDESLFQNLNIKATTESQESNLLKISETVNNETKNLDSVEAVSDNAYKYDYIISHDQDVRAGTIMLVWEDNTNQGRIMEFSSSSVGDTDDFVFNVGSSGGIISLSATCVKNYIVKLNRYSF